mgnify:CR=1 FL=1
MFTYDRIAAQIAIVLSLLTWIAMVSVCLDETIPVVHVIKGSFRFSLVGANRET